MGIDEELRARGDADDLPSRSRDGTRDSHGERRTNDTHASTTDPVARLYRKGPGQEAKLCFVAHVLMESRHGLVVDAELTRASGHAEWLAALASSSKAFTWYLATQRVCCRGSRTEASTSPLFNNPFAHDAR